MGTKRDTSVASATSPFRIATIAVTSGLDDALRTDETSIPQVTSTVTSELRAPRITGINTGRTMSSILTPPRNVNVSRLLVRSLIFASVNTATNLMGVVPGIRETSETRNVAITSTVPVLILIEA